MNHITVKDRVMAHLMRYNHVGYDVVLNAPAEITQDGIASAVGISRSHVSQILGDMLKRKEISYSVATIKNSQYAIKRKTYHLTEYGKLVYRRRAEDLQNCGLSPSLMDPPLNINYCSTEGFDTLSMADIDRIGCLCVMRRTFTRSDLEG